MSKHEVDYSYYLPEWSTIELEMDEDLPSEEKEELAVREIERLYPDIEQIDVEEIRFNG